MRLAGRGWPDEAGRTRLAGEEAQVFRSQAGRLPEPGLHLQVCAILSRRRPSRWAWGRGSIWPLLPEHPSTRGRSRRFPTTRARTPGMRGGAVAGQTSRRGCRLPVGARTGALTAPEAAPARSVCSYVHHPVPTRGCPASWAHELEIQGAGCVRLLLRPDFCLDPTQNVKQVFLAVEGVIVRPLPDRNGARDGAGHGPEVVEIRLEVTFATRQFRELQL
jgi:hypothetical protein